MRILRETIMENGGLKAEVEAAVEHAFQSLGPKGLDKKSVIAQFKERGVSLATLYRWIDAYVATGKPAGRLIQKAKRSAQKAKERSPKRALGPEAATADVAGKALTSVPTPLTVAEIAGDTTVDVISKLRDCVANAEQVIRFAKNEKGDVRLAKTLLSASEHLRRSVESMVKLHEAIHNVSQVDRFHREIVAMLEDVARDHPAAGARILAGLRSVAAQYRV